MREAANTIATELGTNAVQPVAWEIARRVVTEHRQFVQAAADPFAMALRELASKDSVTVLASDPEIDTSEIFIAERIKRLRSRGGSYLTRAQQEEELRAIEEVMFKRLANRYERHIRNAKGL